MSVSAARIVTPRFFISHLCNLLDTYLKPEPVKEVYRAYMFGAQAHDGQHRVSGEPYIHHPPEVARILAEMRLDHRTIIAALLHDVIEDTDVIKQHIIADFGKEVAELVDGVSKLTQIEFDSRAEAQAENFRKMLLAMTQDIRVILVKLADRLHNMRTLMALRAKKRRTIARETLDIYVPIASRLGINNLRLELEDLGFAIMYPLRYRVLKSEVKKARGHRKEVLKKIRNGIKARLREENLRGRVKGREKHLYSLYKKMRDKRMSFREVLDVYAFRIIVANVDSCYRVLGVIHNLYKPVSGRFKDYIAISKANGYQSLHTVVFGPFGLPIEIQIRTEDMHKVAEAGIAAHWTYKDGGGHTSAAHKRAHQWMRELLEMQKRSGNTIEFIENVKVDLFPRDVYVFTPQGRIMELTRGATPVDFAYAVHSDVGNTCVAAKIDRHYTPLSTPLVNGQTVEIVTAPWGQPSPGWLNFVVTGKARANIRNYLKNLQTGEAMELGSRLLKNALAAEGSSLEEIPGDVVKSTLEGLGLGDLKHLLRDIGLGKRIASLVARRFTPHDEIDKCENEAHIRPHAAPLAIKGTEGMVINFGKCCRPIPGDHIHGFVSAGRGIVIHTHNCKNVAEHMERPENLIEVEWETNIKGDFPVDIRMEIADKRGVLATIAASIADSSANIENVNIEDRDDHYNGMHFTIDVRSRQHLAKVIRRLRTLNSVHRIWRARS